MKRILVTGATGFVGRVLCRTLHDAGFSVRAAVRTQGKSLDGAHEQVVVGDINGRTDWSHALQDVDAVVHTAARVHIMDMGRHDAEPFMETNARGTRQLAESAARAGVRRVVHLSSVKVNGEGDTPRPYTADDRPAPADAYAESKLQAEQCLTQVAAATGIEVVSVRSPLVYGPGVRANFLRLLAWVDKGRPMPFGSLHNQRSLISVWNLCDLLVHVVAAAPAAGRTWMASDGMDLSTPDLIRHIGAAMNKPVALLPVPRAMLVVIASCIGKRAEMARLCGSLTIDLSRTRRDLGWSPPLGVAEGIGRTARWYLGQVCR